MVGDEKMKKLACLGLLCALLMCGCASQNEDGFVQDKTCITVAEDTPIDLALCEVVASSIEEGKEVAFFEEKNAALVCEQNPGFLETDESTVLAADADADGADDYLVLDTDNYILYNENGKIIFEKKSLAAAGGFFAY